MIVQDPETAANERFQKLVTQFEGELKAAEGQPFAEKIERAHEFLNQCKAENRLEELETLFKVFLGFLVEDRILVVNPQMRVA